MYLKNQEKSDKKIYLLIFNIDILARPHSDAFHCQPILPLIHDIWVEMSEGAGIRNTVGSNLRHRVGRIGNSALNI